MRGGGPEVSRDFTKVIFGFGAERCGSVAALHQDGTRTPVAARPPGSTIVGVQLMYSNGRQPAWGPSRQGPRRHPRDGRRGLGRAPNEPHFQAFRNGVTYRGGPSGCPVLTAAQVRRHAQTLREASQPRGFGPKIQLGNAPGQHRGRAGGRCSCSAAASAASSWRICCARNGSGPASESGSKGEIRVAGSGETDV